MKNYLKLFRDYGAGGGGISYNTPANTAGANLANNGLSVSGGKVQLGGLAGSAAAAVLLNNREIPLGGFNLLLSGQTTLPALTLQQGTTPNLIPQLLFTNNVGTEVGRLAFPDVRNIFIGPNAGFSATAGGTNGKILIGNSAGHDLTTNDTIIAIGSGALQGTGASPVFSDVIAIGNDVFDRNGATITGNNMIIGNNSCSGGAALAFGGQNLFLGNHNSQAGLGGASVIGSTNIVVGMNNQVGNISNSIILATFNNGASLMSLSNVVIIGTNIQNILLGQTVAAWSDNGSKLQLSGSISQPITVQAGNFTLDNTTHTVIFTAAATATLPTAAAGINRKYYIVAAGAAFNVTTSINFNNLANASVNTIAAGGSALLQSDGTTWRQIK